MDVVRFALLGLGAGSVYALMALGLVLVYRGSGVLNFAQGAMGMIGAFTFYVWRDDGMPTVLAFALSVATGHRDRRRNPLPHHAAAASRAGDLATDRDPRAADRTDRARPRTLG